MSVANDYLLQDATHWPRDGHDGTGGWIYAAPDLVACRWQDRAELFRDPEGQERTSSAVVYLDVQPAVGDLLLLGESSDSPPPADAREVRQVGVSPAIDNGARVVKVWL